MIALQHTFERSNAHNLSISHAPDRRHARHLRFEDKPSPGFVHKHVMSFEMHWWKGCRGRALKACRKSCRSYPRGRGPVLLPERKECLPDQGHLWATMQHLNLLAVGHAKYIFTPFSMRVGTLLLEVLTGVHGHYKAGASSRAGKIGEKPPDNWLEAPGPVKQKRRSATFPPVDMRRARLHGHLQEDLRTLATWPEATGCQRERKQADGPRVY